MRLGFHPATETTLEIHAESVASESRSVTLAEIDAFAAQPIPEKPAEMIALGKAALPVPQRPHGLAGRAAPQLHARNRLLPHPGKNRPHFLGTAP